MHLSGGGRGSWKGEYYWVQRSNHCPKLHHGLYLGAQSGRAQQAGAEAQRSPTPSTKRLFVPSGGD